MKMKRLGIMLLLLSGFLAKAGAEDLFNEFAQKSTSGTLSLEDSAQIQNWQASGGSVTISEQRYKQGKSSALWKWEPGGYLLMKDPAGLTRACQPYEGGSPELYERSYVAPGKLLGGVKMWLYNETAQPDGRVMLQVGHDEKTVLSNPRYRIPVNLNFTGWRTIWVHFEDDARVENYSGPEEMRCLALIPNAGSSGALYIDWINFVTYLTPKRHSDYQVVYHKARKDVDYLLEYDQGLKKITPEPLTPAQTEAFKTIEERCLYLILGSGKGVPASSQKELSSKFKSGGAFFDKLKITVQDGVVHGVPLFSTRDEHNTPDGEIHEDTGQNALFPLALEYRLTGRPEALTNALNLLDHLYDQGFAAGSTMGTGNQLIRVNGFSAAVLLLNKELTASGRMAREAGLLSWISRLGAAYEFPADEGVNTDLVRGGAFPKLISVLMMKDGPEKAGAMKGLVNYYNHVCAIAPGYMDTIKPDYTLYHHESAYQSAYGVSTVTTMTMIDWLLKGTPYELSAESQAILRNVLDAQLRMANLYAVHPGAGGRFPLNNALDSLMLPAYAFAALSGMEVSDPDMAAKFNRLYRPELNKPGFPTLYYTGTLGTMELMEKVSEAANGRKLGPSAGHYNFPYAAMDVHRRDNWMASVRGWSQYVWDFESGSKWENNLGRYLSHGALFLFTNGDPVSLKGSASDMEKGYHWAFLPGATTKALPMKDVIFKYEATPKYLECKHRNYSDETFVGGVTLGGNGFFSMKLHDTVAPDDEKTLFDDSFRAVKSYFFVDNEIYCLGSGIECKDSRCSTVTTVFQNTLNGEAVPLTVKPGEETGLDGGVLRDIPGNAYFIPQGQNVRVLQSVQESFKRGKEGLVASDGPNYRAWIDHGKAPTAGSYEYLIAVKPAAAQVERLTEKLPFTVLQKNKDAHVIQCLEKGLTAYAVFEPAKALPAGLINSVDTPLLVMTEAQKKTVKLAVADPDLRLQKWGCNMSFMPEDVAKTEAAAHTATITLNGKWKLAAPVEGVKIRSAGWFGGKTVVETVLQHGLTKECALICD